MDEPEGKISAALTEQLLDEVADRRYLKVLAAHGADVSAKLEAVDDRIFQLLDTARGTMQQSQNPQGDEA